ncbi:ABC transporter ATP-binding protein [Shewanella waksmanii]|uniref:ABC transporter ATP-binding protein n=1 Tax=Shewanella waksmanii TaxID=213783 RepID=UPI0004AD141E|nr:ABC transporter ATP-binding protein [Shewanella waksmanii]
MHIEDLAVSLQAVSHQFGDFAALTEVDCALQPGQLLALLGHNGAGKSTLLKVILGLIDPSHGQVTVLGQRLSAHNRKPMNIGYLPENISFYDKLTGHELLSYFAALKGVGQVRVNRLIEEFGLQYAQHKPLKGYSKGMKQRLGIAQAILAEPQLLLLDEPTVGLDPQASEFLYQKIQSLTQLGCAVMVSTHELNLIEPQLDVAMVMGQGRNLATGPMDSLVKQSQLPVTIRFDDMIRRVTRYNHLAAFYHNGALRCPVAETESLVEYLTTQCHIFDFEIEKPGLSALYQELMAPMQQNDEQGIVFQPVNQTVLVGA